MVRKMFAALVLAGMIAATPTLAAPCRGAKGKFVKCPPAATISTAGVMKDKNGRCHVASGPKRGQFTKC